MREVGVVVGDATGPRRRRPEGAFRTEVVESARATELGQRLADAQALMRSAVCRFGSVGCRGGCGEDEAEVVVCQFVGVGQEEVRRDAPLSAAELPLAALDLPNGGAVPEVRVGRAVEPSRGDAPEGEYVAWGELDRPGLVERAVIRKDEARDEQRFLALAWFHTAGEPISVNCRDQYLARRACALLEHSGRERRDPPAELQRVDSRL